MSAPFERLRARPGFGWLGSRWAIVLALVLSGVFGYFASLNETAEHPGILQLELSGTSDTALALLRAFADAQKVDAVRFAIGMDVPFIISYVWLVSAILSWFKNHRPRRGEPDDLLDYAAWGIVIAGVLDAIEDVAMYRIITESVSSPSNWLGLASFVGTTAALAKWTLVCAVVAYTAWESRRYVRGFFKPSGEGQALPAGEPAPGAPAPASAPTVEPKVLPQVLEEEEPTEQPLVTGPVAEAAVAAVTPPPRETMAEQAAKAAAAQSGESIREQLAQALEKLRALKEAGAPEIQIVHRDFGDVIQVVEVTREGLRKAKSPETSPAPVPAPDLTPTSKS